MSPGSYTTKEKIRWLVAMGVVVGLLAVGLLNRDTTYMKVHQKGNLEQMGTFYTATLYVAPELSDAAERAIANGVSTTRLIGIRMSTYVDDSELSKINRAPAGEAIPVDPEIYEVLLTARKLYTDTRGAFDVTIFPVVRLYREMGGREEVPTAEQIAEARASSHWDDFVLENGMVRKLRASAAIDLGGIAKGYAVDRALDDLRSIPAEGGQIEIGGDLRCFGRVPGREAWIIGIQDPFQPDAELLLRLAVRDAAVCTSGNYRRVYEADGKRYSHILDPRDPRRREACAFPASVTVVAPTTIEADAWATALTVLGPEGLHLLRDEAHDGIEAMIVTGTQDKPAFHYSDGFEAMIYEEDEGEDEDSAAAGAGPLAATP